MTKPPVIDHPVAEPSVFTASALMDSVRATRRIPHRDLPAVCILEFDGDLTDWLVQRGLAHPVPAWACFHTVMYAIELDGIVCGIIPRTIGGPYAVLIAEQLHAAGARLTVGLTSAGRVAADLPVPGLVVATSAIRDEGTSYHYLPPAESVACPTAVSPLLATHLSAAGFPVRLGAVWTTDAPYRETSAQLSRWAAAGVLAVEMQAASLFAFATARNASVALVARVSNAVDHEGEQFDTGSHEQGLAILNAIARAARAYLEPEPAPAGG